MCPVSNRPTRLYKTAKTHKLELSQDVTREDIKFPLITNRAGTDTNNAAKVISNYLKHLCTNEYTINDTESFFQELSTLPPFEEDEGDVSYDVESPLTNIQVIETTFYIIGQIYVQKKLKRICTMLIFTTLFL